MPTAPTANPISYEIYGFSSGVITLNNGAGTPAIISIVVDKPNKVAFSFDNETIQFEGGDTTDKVFLTTGMDLTFDADAVSITARGDIFGTAPVTSISGYSQRLYAGTVAENTGVTAGFRGRAHANKRVSGTQVGTVVVEVEIFLGTLTMTNGGAGLTTKAKAEAQQMKLSASQTSKDLLGVALTGVPAGGAFYAISEVTP